ASRAARPGLGGLHDRQPHRPERGTAGLLRPLLRSVGGRRRLRRRLRGGHHPAGPRLAEAGGVLVAGVLPGADPRVGGRGGPSDRRRADRPRREDPGGRPGRPRHQLQRQRLAPPDRSGRLTRTARVPRSRAVFARTVAVTGLVAQVGVVAFAAALPVAWPPSRSRPFPPEFRNSPWPPIALGGRIVASVIR